MVITRHEPPHFMRLAPIAGWKQRAYLWIDGQVNRAAAAVIAPSARTEEELLSLGVSAESIHRIPLGLDLGRIEQAGRTSTARGSVDRPRVGIFGRLSWEKSVDTALRAWPEVLSRQPDALLVVVGDGPLRQRLETQAQALGIAGGVEFTGWRDDVPALMSTMDVVLHTSVTESTGMVLIEALVRRRPLVATPVGVIEEYLRHGEDCLVVPHGSSGDVSRAVLKLLENPDLGRAIGEHGNERVLTNFEAARMSGAYLELYDRVVEGRA